VKRPTTDEKPHIIFITTDEQRYDTIAALGASFMETPNLDRLVSEGISFSNCFVTAPSCVPSRASIFTGNYPHNTSVLCNGDTWEPTWVGNLADAGYHCVSIGKMHTVPEDVRGGFHQRFIVENKDRNRNLDTRESAFYDEWEKYLAHEGIVKPSRENYKYVENYENALGAYEWPYDKKYHPDVFVGNMAVWWLRNRESDSPLFLKIGFPGPHPPFDPIEEYTTPYMKKELPLPRVTEEEIEKQPKHHHLYRDEMIHSRAPHCRKRNNGDHDALKWKQNPAPEELKRMRAYYYANITMIDEKIGDIIDVLEEKGYLENTVIIFSSDHGDAMGDHGHIEKWTMYDCVTRIPLIVWAPGRFKGGRVIESLIQNMDIAPTILELSGETVPETFDALSLTPLLNGEKEKLREYVFAEHGRDPGQLVTGTDLFTMVRSGTWKLVHYLGDTYGELYNLTEDPEEKRNLWDDASYADKKQELLSVIQLWRMESSYRARPTIMEGRVEKGRIN
jgi:arylsulfatase A-like enzyme